MFWLNLSADKDGRNEMATINEAGLQIDAALHDFVAGKLLAGTDVTPAAFWSDALELASSQASSPCSFTSRAAAVMTSAFFTMVMSSTNSSAAIGLPSVVRKHCLTGVFS